ncbi:MAG TPA: flagellar protein FliT [Selenomonadales bacterium]|nr:flagellar protein FliT [Selenomonadales bacterium]
MSQEAKGDVLLKHYSNIKQLTQRQLELLRSGYSEEIGELISQKQIIVDTIRNSDPDLAGGGFSTEAIEKCRHILSEITAMEEESERLLHNHMASTRGELVTSQQGKTLRQAYEAPFASGNVVNRVK